MNTIGKTDAELVALLNAELRKHKVCNDVHAKSVYHLPDSDGPHGANWDSNILQGSGTMVLPDCMQVFDAAKFELQRKYHLLTDE